MVAMQSKAPTLTRKRSATQPIVAAPSRPMDLQSLHNAIMDEEDEDNLASAFAARDPTTTAHLTLMHQLAIAIIMRDHLPPSAAPQLAAELPSVVAATLYLIAEGSSMLAVPLVDQGSMVSGPLRPQGGLVGRGTAAWTVAASGAPLLWRVPQQNAEVKEMGFPDWGEVAGQGVAVATVPVRLPGCISYGAITYTLGAEPTPDVSAALLQFAGCLCNALSHEGKFVSETSLGYLTRAFPPTVIRRMLSNSSSGSGQLPPPAAMLVNHVRAATASPSGAANVSGPPAGPAGVSALVGLVRCVSEPSSLAAAQDAFAGLLTAPSGGGGSLGIPTPGDEGPTESDGIRAVRAAEVAKARLLGSTSVAPSETTALAHRPLLTRTRSSSNASSGSDEYAKASGPSSASTASDKWRASKPPADPYRQTATLEFVDPSKERRFRRWLQNTQLGLDLRMFTINAVMLVLLFTVLAVRGTLGGAAFILALQCMTGMIVPAVFHRNNRLYPKHRTALILACRAVSILALLVHWCVQPGFYAAGWLRAVTARSVPRLLSSAIHNRLRVTTHAVAVLAELYLAAMAATYVYSRHGAQAREVMGPGATIMVQAGAAAASIGVSYLMEASARRAFLASVQSGTGVSGAPLPAAQ